MSKARDVATADIWGGSRCPERRNSNRCSLPRIEYIQKIAQRFLDGTLSGEVFEEADQYSNLTFNHVPVTGSEHLDAVC